ncbi:DUF2993 domain-containing protein [Streptomyces sp. WMMC905]|uniref:LmeA family phospholipid-binding protein n=1 Tax=Streptomyces sp. WMMC905 TaxID=3404123 RepID=UPI003B9431D7
MRALRILLIFVVIVGGLFVAADRVAVHLAEGRAAEELRSAENLSTTPEVSIRGFPFLTQVAGKELDDVAVRIEDYEATTGDGTGLRIARVAADMKGVRFTSDFGSVTAATATGTATIAYDELMKFVASEPTEIVPGVTARVAGISDGGDGKIKLEVAATVLGTELAEPVPVLSSVRVEDGKLQVEAGTLPAFGPVELSESRFRKITDFQESIDRLPGGVSLESVRAVADGVELTVAGSDVVLAG